MDNWVNTVIKNEDIIINSKVSIVRNINTKLFPKVISVEEGRAIVNDIFELVKNKNADLKYFKLFEGKEDIENDLSKNIITNKLIKNKDKAAYIKNIDETLSILINEQNHIKIQSMFGGLNLKRAFDEVMKIDDKIEENISYAFHEEYGYITTDLTDMGTGLKASVMIHLPALTLSDGIQSLLKGLNQVGMTIRGAYGENTSALGNLYIISNQITLGVQEEEIINNLENVLENIIQEENKCRETIIKNNKYEIEDSIYRAYGILKYARLLTYTECLELLSSLRFGIELGIIELEKYKLNKLLVQVGDKVIKNDLTGVISAKDIEQQRAKIVQNIIG
ncbi:MAG: ATP--guanido phosphotransferase [Clostridium sp.]